MKKAFTLTEILLAVAIVGVIAALVMPSLISKMDATILDNGHLRQTQALHDAIDTLTVAENKHSYFNTSMYSATQPTSYAETSGKFLKKYTRLSKYCGENNGDCFAKEYFKYENGKKETYTPEYKGACAVLKSGATICITPQIGGEPPKGLLDINGPKAPNVFGRDLRIFVLEAQSERAVEKGTSAVLTHTAQPIETPDPTPEPTPEPEPPITDPCIAEPNGLACCQKQPAAQYKSGKKYHHCCNFLQVADKYPQYCAKNITVSLNCVQPQSMTNHECARDTGLWGPGGGLGGGYFGNDRWNRSCLDTTWQRCELITDSSDDFLLEIKFKRPGYGNNARWSTFVTTYNPGPLTIYADMVNGTYHYKLTNTSSGKVLDNSTGGDMDTGILDDYRDQPGHGFATNGAGAISYTYYGPNK